MSGATGASASAPTGPGAAKKKPRTGLMIGLAAGAVVVIGGIVAAIGLNGGFGGGDGGGGEEPQAGPVVPTGSIECWDGSTASGGANCAALSGAEALDWIVRIDGASCSETTVEGAIAKDCTWYDLPNSHLFVMEFDSHDLAVQYGEDAYGNSGSNWKIGADTAGTSWEGGFDTGSGGYSHYYVYEDQPFAVFVRLDNNANGNHDRLSSISSRFSFKPLEDVDYAVATTQRA